LQSKLRDDQASSEHRAMDPRGGRSEPDWDAWREILKRPLPEMLWTTIKGETQ
jgi:hypothetical protein